MGEEEVRSVRISRKEWRIVLCETEEQDDSFLLVLELRRVCSLRRESGLMRRLGLMRGGREAKER